MNLAVDLKTSIIIVCNLIKGKQRRTNEYSQKDAVSWKMVSFQMWTYRFGCRLENLHNDCLVIWQKGKQRRTSTGCRYDSVIAWKHECSQISMWSTENTNIFKSWCGVYVAYCGGGGEGNGAGSIFQHPARLRTQQTGFPPAPLCSPHVHLVSLRLSTGTDQLANHVFRLALKSAAGRLAHSGTYLNSSSCLPPSIAPLQNPSSSCLLHPLRDLPSFFVLSSSIHASVLCDLPPPFVRSSSIHRSICVSCSQYHQPSEYILASVESGMVCY